MSSEQENSLVRWGSVDFYTCLKMAPHTTGVQGGNIAVSRRLPASGSSSFDVGFSDLFGQIDI